MANFSQLLAEQKKRQDKDTVAISEAAQTFSLQIQKEEKLGQEFIRREGISNAAVSVVQNFQGQLDAIADNDFTFLKDTIEKYSTLLSELPGSVDKGRFTDTEATYIAKVVQPVVEELNSIAGPLLRTKLAFRDLAKQFKPLKLAARTLGGIPILGTAITRKIERIEAGEEEVRRAERRKAQDIAREARRSIEDEVAGGGLEQPSAALEETIEERNEQPGRRDIFASETPRAAAVQQTAASEENIEEQRAIEQDRYEETKNLWEMIAEDTYESKELLQRLVDSEEGIMGDLAEGVGGAAAVGGGVAAGVGGTKLASKFFGKKGADQATKSASKKAGSKILGKTLLKSAIKKIPIIGAIAGIGFGIGRLMSGDISGAAMEVASGAASTIPGAGTAASVGIDAALAAKDIKNAEKEIDGVVQTSAEEVVKPDNMKDIVNIDSKRTVVRTTLETDNLENMLQKLLPDNQMQNNIITAPTNTIQNANTTNVLGKMNTKNLDNTVSSLKNVY
jgi:hypothetical protein